MTAHKQPSNIMGRDFKAPTLSRHFPARKGPHRGHILGLAATLSLFGMVAFFVTDNAKATRNDALEAAFDEQLVIPLNIPGHEDPASLESAMPMVEETPIPWQVEKIRKGDSLAAIFSRLGLSAQELDRLMRSGGEEVKRLRRIMPGQELKFNIVDNRLEQLVYEMDALNTLKIQREGDAFQAATESREMEVRSANASGVIDSSLFLAGQEAGLSDNLIMELAGIFGWDVDFALDIRNGDRFTVVYEELFLDGQKQKDGNIIAAEFVNRGQSYRAVRYTDAEGNSDYYSPDGKSMRKAFIRTPVDFTRISSRFGSRYHPILGTMKNHHGVDYAAPTGTPIKAAGDGKLIFVGTKGGYGKTLIIQHGGKYSTLYAHMSRIKPGMHRGKSVKQGQVIGYVGSTGRSTGPHLHYEFRVNGVHRNPLTVKLPDAGPIQAKYKDDFLLKSRGLVALLDVLNRTTVALNETAEAN